MAKSAKRSKKNQYKKQRILHSTLVVETRLNIDHFMRQKLCSVNQRQMKQIKK